MFSWAIFFFVFALIAAFFGFGGLAGTAAGAAEICFYVGLALFFITLLYSLVTGRGKPRDSV